MFIKKQIIVLLSIPFFISTAYCADVNLSKQYDTCMKKANSTQDMIECGDAEFKLQDARLNKAYKTLQQTLNAERKKQLLDTQRLWIKFKESNCNFYFDPDGGSMARLNANACLVTSTADRAKELENLSKN
jgi:uncharacterized protein YecT (DUF1311 family)